MDIISVTDLQQRYGSRVALQDVSFTVEEGEIFGILGPNGAGKTTTVEIIGGLRTADRGEVRVLGLDPRRDRDELPTRSPSPRRWTSTPPSTARPPAGRRSWADLGLADQRRTRYAALSGGQQQRLSVALALVGDPRIAILDELTTGLDPQARRDTWEVVLFVSEATVKSHLLHIYAKLGVRDRASAVAAAFHRGLFQPDGHG